VPLAEEWMMHVSIKLSGNTRCETRDMQYASIDLSDVGVRGCHTTVGCYAFI
jgi:hypothetical protein